jgi:hypothetical protein
MPHHCAEEPPRDLTVEGFTLAGHYSRKRFNIHTEYRKKSGVYAWRIPETGKLLRVGSTNCLQTRHVSHSQYIRNGFNVLDEQDLKRWQYSPAGLKMDLKYG